MGDVREILKNNLVFYTKNKQITQKELSDRLGVTQSAVSHWFKGDNSPNIEVVSKIAEILSIPMSALLSELDSNFVTEIKESSSADKSASEDILARIGRQYGDDARKALSLYVQLDQDDRGEIRGEMKQMLKDDKYKCVPCSKTEVPKAV